MNKIVSATEARKNFFKLLEIAGKPGSSITITLGGRPPVVILSQEEFDGWQETLEIMSDPQLMKKIQAGLADVKSGKTVSLKDVQKRFKK